MELFFIIICVAGSVAYYFFYCFRINKIFRKGTDDAPE